MEEGGAVHCVHSTCFTVFFKFIFTKLQYGSLSHPDICLKRIHDIIGMKVDWSASKIYTHISTLLHTHTHTSLMHDIHRGDPCVTHCNDFSLTFPQCAQLNIHPEGPGWLRRQICCLDKHKYSQGELSLCVCVCITAEVKQCVIRCMCVCKC